MNNLWQLNLRVFPQVVLLIVFLVLTCGRVSAIPWSWYSDVEGTQQAELIVVAQVKEGSVAQHSDKATGGHSLILQITEVLKGNPPKKDFPIFISPGLVPVVGRYLKDNYGVFDYRSVSPPGSKDAIEIFDNGTTRLTDQPLGGDLRQEHIWFLHHVDTRFPSQDTLLGIWNPADIQPIDYKPYFLALLSDHPEKELEDYAKGQPPLAGRARDSLDYLALKRISKISDQSKRCTMLASLFLTMNPKTSGMLYQTSEQIIKEGDEAVSKLVPAFDNPQYSMLRPEIIELWGRSKYLKSGPLLVPIFHNPPSNYVKERIIVAWERMDYSPAAPLLIDLLKKEDRFWADQKIQDKNWWNNMGKQNSPEEKLRLSRQDSYGLIYESLNALTVFKVSAAKDVIEQTKKRWESPNFDQDGQISEACDSALKAL